MPFSPIRPWPRDLASFSLPSQFAMCDRLRRKPRLDNGLDNGPRGYAESLPDTAASAQQAFRKDRRVASSKRISRENNCLMFNKNDWAIGGQHLRRDHLGLERCNEVMDRGPVGVIVDDPEP